MTEITRWMGGEGNGGLYFSFDIVKKNIYELFDQNIVDVSCHFIS